jgi:heterodisulfide reductase subunit A
MSMAKYRHQLHEKLPDCDVYELLWDRCTGGKGYREFAREVDATAPSERFRLTEAHRIQGFEERGDKVCVRYVTGSRATELDVDLAVIAPPLGGHPTNRDLARLLRIETDADGFFVEEHRHLQPFRALVDGVLIAGAAHGPKDVQATVAHAAAAAGEVLAAIVPGRKLVIEAATAAVDEQRCGGCRLCVAACPYQAVSFDAEHHAARVNALLCRACGTCVAGCPSGAIAARHFTDTQLRAEIAAFLGGSAIPAADEPYALVGDAAQTDAQAE